MEFYSHVAAAGNKIICRGYRDGKRFREVVPYSPYLFVPGNPNAMKKFKEMGKESQYKTIYGEDVFKLPFDTIKEAREFMDRYEGTDFNYYGMTNFTYQYINDRFPDKIEFDPSWLSIVSLDIEVASPEGFPDLATADQPIVAITLTKKGRAITFGLKPYTTKIDNHHYFHAKDEVELLMTFLEVWSKNKQWMPDIVTGWSVEEFDIVYIVRRIKRVLGEKYVSKLSPNGYVSTREIVIGKNASAETRKITVYDLSGITILDYLQLYKRYTRTTQESYSLKNISQVELSETKIEFEGTLHELYEEDFETYIDYNLKDAFLVERLETKLNYIQLILRIAYGAKINYADALTTSRPWDAIIHTHLLAKNIVIPQYKEVEDTGKIRGAFVKEVVPGMYKWVVSVDFDSLYPRLISQQNISNETLMDVVSMSSIDDLLSGKAAPIRSSAAEDTTICANGARYRKDIRGFIPELVDQFIEERVQAKKKMIELKKLQERSPNNTRAIEIGHLNSFQESWKILTNGLYGALAMRYFRWYDIRLAEFVTMTGQLSVRWVLNDINKYLNDVLKTKEVDYIIAADTDSCYICLEKLVEKIFPIGGNYTVNQKVDFVDSVMKERIEPLISQSCATICNMLNAYIPKLSMKREAICDKTVWRAKKNYILNMWDDEGVRFKEPKIKMKGIEAIRASTPLVCREAIKKSIKILMSEEEKNLHTFIHEFKKNFMELPFEQVSFPRSVNNIQKYWDAENQWFRKKTPPNVRASVTYNNLLKEMNLTQKYHLIKDKDKIKWVWLKKPNPIQANVIAAFDDFPDEFGMKDYIDYDKQFEKTFRHPVETIIKTVGWTTEYIPTLEKFCTPKK